MKTILFFITLGCNLLFASSQIIMVTANTFTSTTASLQRYELINSRLIALGEKIHVNLGRSGLGWSNSEIDIPHRDDEPVKREGDSRAPAGVFYITGSFGYFDAPNKHFPYIQSTQELICVDDVNASTYNSILTRSKAKDVKSFETMRRSDNQYELGLTLSHNKEKIPYHGSCVFLHVEKAQGAPTSGCTSMAKEDLRTLLQWLNIEKKPLLIQLPSPYYLEIGKLISRIKAL
jgi:L,D-peptidoglycan transpeptidase YkuD (ErfK/YbiS/YcfS/YnhG family)